VAAVEAAGLKMSCLFRVLLAGWLLCIGCTTAGPRDPIRSASVAFMQPGVTPRREVTANLGTPTQVWEQERVAVYEWEEWSPRNRRRLERPGYYDSRRAHAPVYHRISAFCVAYDAAGLVARHHFLEAEGSEDLEAKIKRWLATP
jgi:hypothetical protein